MHTDKEWIRTVLSHRKPAAIPYYFDFTPPARAMVESYYGSPAEDVLRFPIRMRSCTTIKPLYADPEVFGDRAKDEWGVIWATSKLDRGAPIGPCLSEANLSSYTFPDYRAQHRFKDIGDWCEQNKEHFTIIWAGRLWERATFIRGMENILMDLVLNPAFVEELLQGIADYTIGTMKILFERFAFDGIALSDDYGMQKSLLMSPSDWRRFIKPHLAKIYDFAKTHGRIVFHHSDGNIHEIIGDLVDLGCDILHPIQSEVMDVFALKREFGRDISFCGGVRTQDLLPRGRPEEVRDEVRKLKRELGRGGGYIFSNGITIQADVPLENLIAMIDEARRIEY
ncbi:MAG: uroporphyrinogen decarboxylase family protein [Candidatus Latescibacter sp.]|nr:uroporphyrinogen decarboxylase family protein [Candidatus Latescibacter sp.]